MDRVNAHRGCDRCQQRDEDEHRAQDVHHHADGQQQRVEQEEELPVFEVLALNPLDHEGRDVFLFEELAERERHDQDHEERTEEHARLAEDGRDGLELERAVQPDLDHDGIGDADGGRFDRVEDTAVNATENQDREHQRPEAVSCRCRQLLELERRGRDLVHDALVERVADQNRPHHEAGAEAGGEQTLDLDHRALVDDRVHDHRDRWRNQNAERARRGEQPMGEAFLIALGDQRGAHHGADRDDGCGARTADCGEEHARQNAAHRHATRDPSDESLREFDQALADLSPAHDRAAHDEERDGEQGGAVREAANAFDDDRVLADVPEAAPQKEAP